MATPGKTPAKTSEKTSETTSEETSEKVKGPASYFPSIEKTYGKPIDHWMQVLQDAGALKHMELVAHLKAAHQVGHGHANALVAWSMAKR